MRRRRILAAALSAAGIGLLGPATVPGAAGTLGPAVMAANAKPDGYTLEKIGLAKKDYAIVCERQAASGRAISQRNRRP